jgi:hypothetical protein
MCANQSGIFILSFFGKRKALPKELAKLAKHFWSSFF